MGLFRCMSQSRGLIASGFNALPLLMPLLCPRADTSIHTQYYDERAKRKKRNASP